MLKVNEIFHSIQGESSHAGRPCVFVRLTGCNLRCVWCDTEYAFHDGRDMTIDEVLRNLSEFDCLLVEITGGEPLLQPEAVDLMKRLLDKNYEVMLETGGSLPIDKVPREVIKIVDFKAPGSGMAKKNLWTILDDLAPHDELKFVIADRIDYTWARDRLEEYDLPQRWITLFSPVYGNLELSTLAEWILEDKLPVRLQSQLHKHIWGSDKRGV